MGISILSFQAVLWHSNVNLPLLELAELKAGVIKLRKLEVKSDANIWKSAWKIALYSEAFDSALSWQGLQLFASG